MGKMAKMAKMGSSLKSGLTPGTVAGKSSMINYVFILCFFCSVVPGLLQTVLGEDSSKDGVDRSLIACKFGDAGKGMNTDIENSTSLRNIKEMLKTSVDVSTTKVVNNQEVTIKEADDMNDDVYLSLMTIQQECPGNGIAGFLGFTNKKNAYGCMPDISQSADINMSQLSEDIVDYSEEITSAIANELVAEASGSSGSSDEAALNQFKDEVIDEVKEETTELLVKMKDRSIEQTQKTNLIEIKLPLACSCDSKGTLIDSSFQLDLYAKELREDVRKKIMDKAIEKDIKLEFKGADEKSFMQEFACIFQIIACTGCILGVLLLIKTVMSDNTKMQEKSVEAEETRLTESGRAMNQMNIEAGRSANQMNIEANREFQSRKTMESQAMERRLDRAQKAAMRKSSKNK